MSEEIYLDIVMYINGSKVYPTRPRESSFIFHSNDLAVINVNSFRPIFSTKRVYIKVPSLWPISLRRINNFTFVSVVT